MFTSHHNARQSKRTFEHRKEKNKRTSEQKNIKKKTKTKWSKKSSILKSVQKWNKLPPSKRTFNYKNFFKHVLTEFLLDQRKKNPLIDK